MGGPFVMTRLVQTEPFARGQSKLYAIDRSLFLTSFISHYNHEQDAVTYTYDSIVITFEFLPWRNLAGLALIKYRIDDDPEN